MIEASRRVRTQRSLQRDRDRTGDLIVALIAVILGLLLVLTRPDVPDPEPGYYPACEGLPGMLGDDC